MQPFLSSTNDERFSGFTAAKGTSSRYICWGSGLERPLLQITGLLVFRSQGYFTIGLQGH